MLLHTGVLRLGPGPLQQLEHLLMSDPGGTALCMEPLSDRACIVGSSLQRCLRAGFR